jgi:hypothetical protein
MPRKKCRVQARRNHDIFVQRPCGFGLWAVSCALTVEVLLTLESSNWFCFSVVWDIFGLVLFRGATGILLGASRCSRRS